MRGLFAVRYSLLGICGAQREVIPRTGNRGDYLSRGRDLSSDRDFNVSVGVAPDQRQASEPIFSVDGAANAGSGIGREDAGGGGEFGAGDFSADGTGGDLDLGIVANALDLAELARSHEAECVAVLGEPDGSVDGDAGFAESSERDVLLAVDFGGDGHRQYCNDDDRLLAAAQILFGLPGGIARRHNTMGCL